MLIQKATESCVSRKTGLVELEIWMEWQLGQSSINQFLFVYCVYVVYACDAQTNCIKILTSLKQTAEFLMHWARFRKPSQSMKGTWRTGSLVFKRRSGWSATLFSYCTGMKLLSEARLPIYQKPSMAHTLTI